MKLGPSLRDAMTLPMSSLARSTARVWMCCLRSNGDAWSCDVPHVSLTARLWLGLQVAAEERLLREGHLGCGVLGLAPELLRRLLLRSELPRRRALLRSTEAKGRKENTGVHAQGLCG